MPTPMVRAAPKPPNCSPPASSANSTSGVVDEFTRVRPKVLALPEENALDARRQ